MFSCAKDIETYLKEEKTQTALIEKMTAENKDPYDIRKQVGQTLCLFRCMRCTERVFAKFGALSLCVARSVGRDFDDASRL